MPTVKRITDGKFPLPKDTTVVEPVAKEKDGKTVAPKEKYDKRAVTYLKMDKKKKNIAKAYFGDGLYY